MSNETYDRQGEPVSWQKLVLSLTSGFSWVLLCKRGRNYFNGLLWRLRGRGETVETVRTLRSARSTRLKLGVNEKGTSRLRRMQRSRLLEVELELRANRRSRRRQSAHSSRCESQRRLTSAATHLDESGSGNLSSGRVILSLGCATLALLLLLCSCATPHAPPPSAKASLENFKLTGDLSGEQAAFTLTATANVTDPKG